MLASSVWIRHGAAVISLALSSVAVAHAGPVTEVTSRAALGANDLLNWGVLPEFPPSLPNPATATSAGGLAVTVSTPPGTSLAQVGTTRNFLTDFAPTDILLQTEDLSPITLSFAKPVFGAGLQVENEVGDNLGTFTFAATVTAFDGPTELGSFTEDGQSLGGETGDAPFLGVSSATADITSLTYNLVIVPDGFNEGLLVNQLSLLTKSTTPPPVPEPASFAVLGVGLLGLGLVRRRRSKRPAG